MGNSSRILQQLQQGSEGIRFSHIRPSRCVYFLAYAMELPLIGKIRLLKDRPQSSKTGTIPFFIIAPNPGAIADLWTGRSRLRRG